MFLICTSVGASTSAGLLLVVLSRILLGPVLHSGCLAVCRSCIVAILLYVACSSFVSGCSISEVAFGVLLPDATAAVLRCSWACLLPSTALLCSCLQGWSRSSHLCCRCSCPKSWWCCRPWALLLDEVEDVAGCSWRACWPSPARRWRGGRELDAGISSSCVVILGRLLLLLWYGRWQSYLICHCVVEIVMCPCCSSDCLRGCYPLLLQLLLELTWMLPGSLLCYNEVHEGNLLSQLLLCPLTLVSVSKWLKARWSQRVLNTACSIYIYMYMYIDVYIYTYIRAHDIFLPAVRSLHVPTLPFIAYLWGTLTEIMVSMGMGIVIRWRLRRGTGWSRMRGPTTTKQRCCQETDDGSSMVSRCFK